MWDLLAQHLPKSVKSNARYHRSFKTFLGLCGASDVPLRDIIHYDWDTLDWPHSNTDYMHLRRAVSRLIHLALEDHPEIWRRLKKRFRIKQEAERMPDVTIDLFRDMVDTLPVYIQPAIMCLALTGMLPSEYARCDGTNLLPHTKQIRIPGKKTLVREGTLRLGDESWEWVKRAIPCPVSMDWLSRRWKTVQDAFGVSLQLRDLRHFCAQTGADQGLADSKIAGAMRHKTPSMTRRYTMQVDRGEFGEAIERAFFGKPEPGEEQKA